MASSLIHMCVASEINKKYNLPKNMLLLGSIAPDISKLVGETKVKSHFWDENDHIQIDWFLEKYKDQLNHPFMLGYFIHLYTDLLWEKYFISDIVNSNCIELLDGTKVKPTEENQKKLIYNDYTNLNVQLIDIYNLDLSLFYNEPDIPDIYMDEIPVDKLNVLIEKAGIILENTKREKAYTFKIEHIKPFIKTCTDIITGLIDEMSISM